MFLQNNYQNIVISLFILLIPLMANSQTWNPQPNWKDSYAVDGKCYCDSNGYDHGLDTKSADTPVGIQNVVAICEQIEQVLGSGPAEGRIPYNDIQCGNGPANDAADETGCPGRVDIGSAGCNQIGPLWDLETAYADAPDPDNILDRSNWVITASHRNNDVNMMVDDSLSSRWATGTLQTAGQWIEVDLSTTTRFNLIVLNSSLSPDDYPRNYSVFVSADGTNWGEALLTSNGQGSVTNIELGTQNYRYIRIEQNGSNDKYWWSIHELNIYADQTSTPSTPTQPRNALGWISSIISTLLIIDTKE